MHHQRLIMPSLLRGDTAKACWHIDCHAPSNGSDESRPCHVWMFTKRPLRYTRSSAAQTKSSWDGAVHVHEYT